MYTYPTAISEILLPKYIVKVKDSLNSAVDVILASKGRMDLCDTPFKIGPQEYASGCQSILRETRLTKGHFLTCF